MSNDDFGITDNPRADNQQEVGEGIQGIPQAHDEKHDRPETSSSNDERQAVVRKIIESIPEEELGILFAQLEQSQITQWQGELPDPDSYNKYPDFAQHAMVEWNNARTVDESKRLTMLAESIKKGVVRDQWLSFILNTSFALMSFISLLVTGSALSFGFLAIPAVSVAVNIVNDKRKPNQEDIEQKQ